MDINKERIEAVDNLARRYAAETNAGLEFQKTMNRGESLLDADLSSM